MLSAVCQQVDEAEEGQSVENMTPEQRISSVMPMVIKMAKEWHQQLMEREKSAEDLEDLVTIAWIELREKDKYFDPGRGFKYTTWAATVVKNKLGEHRNYMRVVHSPRNSVGRIRSQQCSEKTRRRTRLAMKDPLSIDMVHDSVLAKECDDQVSRTELQQMRSREVQSKVGLLANPQERMVIRLAYGIGGIQYTIKEIADHLDISCREVEQIKKSAESNLASLAAPGAH
jgi:RNA polymerase sigma factor (sigma-70 family)